MVDWGGILSKKVLEDQDTIYSRQQEEHVNNLL